MDQPASAQLPYSDEATLLRRSYDQLQTALSIGLIATWFWDIGNDKVYGDPNLFRLFGIAEPELSAGLPINTFTNVIHADDRERVQTLIEEAVGSGQIYEAEYRIIDNVFESRWVLSRGQVSFDEQRNPLSFSGVLIDVTGRKLAEGRSQVAEDQLRLALEAAQLGTWDFNLLTKELLWSDRCKELFGLSPTAHVDYSVFLQGLHPDDRDRTDRIVQRALQGENGGRYDTEYRTVGLEDGQLRWIRANGKTKFNDEGVATHFIGTVIDITDSKQAETVLQQRIARHSQELERQTQQLRTTLDASLNSIIAMTAIRDDSGTIVDFMMDTANEAVIRSNFMTPEEIIGRSMLTVFPGNKDNGFFDLYVDVVNTGKPQRSTQYYRDDLGLEGWFEVSAVKQDNDGVVVTYNNITERKQAELAAQRQATELREANAELKRSNESLQQFAHIASHDLQEPLRRIQSFSDLLKTHFADSLSDGERDMVQRIQRSAHRMQLLVKDLLTYSKLSTYREPFLPVSLNEVIQDVVNDLEMSISEKNAVVSVSDLPEVLGSASRLRQLFQNLIANALKFSPPDTTPVISIACHLAQPQELPSDLQEAVHTSYWLITVADNGIGFDERYKDRIFTPFQRLHDQAAYGGTGIGLAICQRVTESHGGAMDVSSQPGQGSTFKVFLPVSSQ
ncbi:PAS domain-containing sensor histidine kinase [Spirosoma koreense]